MKKRFIRIIVLAVLVATVIFGVRWFRDRQKGSDGNLLKIYGTIDIRDASLAFNDQERISQVLVEEGDRVQAGQVLARQQTDRLKAQIAEAEAQVASQRDLVRRYKAGSRPQEIDQARAEVEAAKVTVANDERIFERLRKTAGAGATSIQDRDNAQSRLLAERARLKVKEKALNLAQEGPRKEDVAAAVNRLKALEANLAYLKIRLRDMTLKAPAAGIIESRILEPGEMASPTRPVFILALTDPKWVRAYIPEPELGRIRLGMEARILSDSYPGQSMEGWVGFISPVAEFTPKTVETEDLRSKLVYEARVFVHDAEDRLRLGMPVTVLINVTTPAKEAEPVSSPSVNPPAAGK